jgi:hypothetical protein
MPSTLPSRTSGNKLSKKERGLIIEHIVSLLLKNARRSEIIVKCEPFNLSERMIDKYIRKCHEMIADRPMEAVERARRIEYSRIEEQQRNCEHQRDWTELEKLKLRLLGLDSQQVEIHHHKHKQVDDDKLLEIVSE